MFDDKAGLVLLVERGVQANGFTLAALGPQVFAEPSVIVCDQRVGGLEDNAGRAVVLFQAQGARAGKIFLEALQIFDARTAPAVDRLIVVTDDSDVRITARKHPQPGVLDGIGVLEFVDQNMLEALLVVRQQRRVVQPQLVRAQQQLGKVHQAGTPALLFIGLVDGQLLAHKGVAAVIDVLRALPLVLARVDEPLHLARRPAAFVQLHGLENTADDPVLVVGVQYLETLRQTGLLPVSAQQPVRQPVEGTDPHTARRHAHQLLDARAHFAGRLVGERHRQYAVRRHIFDLDQPGNPMHQYPGLAAAGPCQYQQRVLGSGHRLALGVIQWVDNVGNIHACILTKPPAGAWR